MSYINNLVRLQCKLNRKHSRSSMGLWDSTSGKCLNTWSETETSLVHLLSPSTGTYSCFDLCRHQTYKPVSKNSQRRAFPKKGKANSKGHFDSIWVKKKEPPFPEKWVRKGQCRHVSCFPMKMKDNNHLSEGSGLPYLAIWILRSLPSYMRPSRASIASSASLLS